MSAARLPAVSGEPVTVALPDEIDMDTAPGAWLDLMAALRAGTGVVIADMTGTVFCDGSGADMLADAHREAVAAGVDLRIAAPSPRVLRVLELTRLDGVLAIYPTLSAALAGTLPDEALRPAPLRRGLAASLRRPARPESLGCSRRRHIWS